MNLKEWLKKTIKDKETEIVKLKKRSDESEDVKEVRSIGDAIQALRDEADEARAQLAEAEEVEEPKHVEERGGTPLAAYGNLERKTEKRESESVLGSMEYRTAFMAYVQRATPIPEELVAKVKAERRAGGDIGVTATKDIGMIIPQTVMQEFIKEASKVYGHIYAKVRKLNVQGGLDFPISKLKANFRWIGEGKGSETQKAGDIKEEVTFKYHTGEIRVAETLLAHVVSLDLFEAEIVRIMIEAYVEAMDKGIILGTGDRQLTGITNDPRVTNVITLSPTEFADWTAWRKQLFAKVPLSKRGQGEFLFPSSTVESYLMTMKDKNDRPLFKEAADLSMGNTSGKFFGRVTDLVEPDIITDFDTAAVGDVVGIFWVPNDYAINTNLQFGLKVYINEETNDLIHKALTILDGKILDTSGCYIIKKGAEA